MITGKHYPATRDDLLSLLTKNTGPADTVVMQAGHFLLYYDNTEAIVLPGIATELRSPRHTVIADEIGHYPLLTWQLGIPLLAALDARRRLVMVVANDWQYLPDNVDRFDFYRRAPRLPGGYRQLLEKHPQVSLLTFPRQPNFDTGDYFSEQTLRNAYARHIKDLIKEKKLPPHARVESGRELKCTLEDAVGKQREIYCSGKRQNCTHEVAELVWTVQDLAQATVFVNFFPLVCKEYMIEGTELSHELFMHGVRTVVNIGMQSSHVRNEADIFQGSEVIVHAF
jgi:hypothetical protein